MPGRLKRPSKAGRLSPGALSRLMKAMKLPGLVSVMVLSSFFELEEAESNRIHGQYRCLRSNHKSKRPEATTRCGSCDVITPRGSATAMQRRRRLGHRSTLAEKGARDAPHCKRDPSCPMRASLRPGKPSFRSLGLITLTMAKRVRCYFALDGNAERRLTDRRRAQRAPSHAP